MHPDKDVDPPPPGSSRWFLGFLGILAAFVAFVYVMRQTDPAPLGIKHPAVGRSLSAIHLEPLVNADEPVTLEDVQGKVTLINFWGPWCPPCLMELPELLEIEKKYRERDDVRILLVSHSGGHGMTLEELEADTRGILLKEQADPPIYQDEDADTIQAVVESAQLEDLAFPTTLLIDRQGKIRAVWTGYMPQFVKEMGDVIEQQLAKG